MTIDLRWIMPVLFAPAIAAIVRLMVWLFGYDWSGSTQDSASGVAVFAWVIVSLIWYATCIAQELYPAAWRRDQ